MDRLSRRIDQLGRPETFSYDGNGNLVSTTDRKTQTTTFTYDPLNRRTRSFFSDGTFTEFTYDGAGRLLTATDSVTGTITEEYDLLDRLLRENTPQGAIQYAYDALGRRTTMTVNGQSPVNYSYDTASRLTQILRAPLNPVMIDYDAAGRRMLLTLPNAVSTAYEYDPASRLTGLIHTGPSGLLGTLTYQYDASGNRIGTGGSWARTGLPGAVSTTSYDGANQQTSFGATTQTYDANGNLLSQTDGAGTTTYTWDGRNRLVAIAGPTVTASFAYDSIGRRIEKAIDGVSTTFLYDGPDIVLEASAIGQTTYFRTPTVDEILTRTDAVDTLAFLTDSLGSAVALTTSAGSLHTEYTYDPFGSSRAAGLSSPNPFQFTGRENDSGTGLYYFRNRYYSPSHHRFISQDPIGLFAGTLNYYGYTHNDPLGGVDPFGLRVIYGRYSVASEELRGRLELFSHQMDRDIIITGGDRDPRTNREAGGAPGSSHLTGNAADFHIEGMSDLQAAQRAAESGLFNGIGYYPPTSPRGGHVHVDLREDGRSPRWRHGRDNEGTWRYRRWYDRTRPLPPAPAPRGSVSDTIRSRK
jgi:RHS repeat-associated protein